MTERKRAFGSDFAKADAHVITREEYDEIPELTDEWFEKATLKIGNRIVSKAEFRKAWNKASRTGRPPSANPKKSVTLRLDADVVAHFRKTGPGWQTRINATLRKAAHLPTSAAARSRPTASVKSRKKA
jgi:uncharacterized protein (DUF4415 family)